MPKKDNRPKTRTNVPMLKMKELIEATGVPKSTILLYVNQGLLPTPVKTSPNMSYYDPVCKQRILFIKRVQSTHRLPLAAIKGLIREMEKGRNIDLLLELQTQVFDTGQNRIRKNAFCRATGLTPTELDHLCRKKILIPLEDEYYDEHDKAVGVLLKQGIEIGLTIDELAFYPEMAEKLIENELKLRECHTNHLKFEENAALTLELTRMARGIRSYVIDRTMQKKLMAFKGLKTHNKG